MFGMVIAKEIIKPLSKGPRIDNQSSDSDILKNKIIRNTKKIRNGTIFDMLFINITKST